MGDSTLHVLKAQPSFIRSVAPFSAILLLAIALTWLFDEPAFTVQQTIVLFLGLFAVGLWISEAVPPFGVALMVIAVLVFTLGYNDFTASPKDVRVYTDTLSSSVIWLLLGGFFLASAMSKVGLDADLIKYSLKVCGTQPRWILFGMMSVTMIASMLMSNATTTVMVVSALMPLINRIGKESKVSKALILGIPIAATTGGMGTLIGSPTNLLAAGAITTAGLSIDFVDWLIFGLPVAVLLTFLCWWLLNKLLIGNAGPVEAPPTSTAQPGTGNSTTQRLVVLTIVIICLGLWLSSPLHGLSATAVSAVPLVLLPLCGILKGGDIRAMGWDTLILVAGGLALGEGLFRSGLMSMYAGRIVDLGIPAIALMFALAYLAMFLSNVMSNSAACAILLPLGALLLPDKVILISVIIGLATSTSLLLPVSTPANAIAYATGVIKQKDFMYGGVFAGVVGPALVVLWSLAVAGLLGL
jgi:sodium-dependent dicarboxylate transporter 2/3/5